MEGIGGDMICVGNWSEMWSENGNSLWMDSSDDHEIGMNFVDNYWNYSMMEDIIVNDDDVVARQRQDDKLLQDHQSKKRSAYAYAAVMNKRSSKRGKTSMRWCSEEDSGLSRTPPCRGSATHPQSLYARKRRERINERLRILQKLVPNGTKVDISTMLQEAVQYVKFLQLQIKLLSSDHTWMYAPLPYNAMDIGLLHTLTLKPQSH